MKRLILYFYLIFFSISVHAIGEDISDFEIEGMSVGNSMLDYFSKEEIFESKKYEYKYDDVFATTSFIKKNFELYDKVQVHYKLSDNNFKIYGLVGVVYFKEDFKDCLKKKDKITSSISTSFSLKKQDTGKREHLADKSGKSFTHDTYFYFSNGNYFSVSCYDWSKEKNLENEWFDNLKVSIIDKDFDDFLQKFYN
tara:strand:+ start:269 stop:856 length:588 start_codon:yes stop_codon:yes gene_type:complete